jgi:catechol 2,3-dioxygenase-like lactoylglutathione lyase family enzyme
MPKIKHIAIATQDAEKTKNFYTEVFGLKEVGMVSSGTVSGYFLSDGDINLAILDFKNNDVAGAEKGMDYSGLHHIGFHVEDLEEIKEKMEAAGISPRDDINKALSMGPSGARGGNHEFKYAAPDGVTVDISEAGWAGTSKMTPPD